MHGNDFSDTARERPSVLVRTCLVPALLADFQNLSFTARGGLPALAHSVRFETAKLRTVRGHFDPGAHFVPSAPTTGSGADGNPFISFGATSIVVCCLRPRLEGAQT